MKKLMIITGGHDFESTFFEIFDSYQDVAYDTMSQPAFNRFITTNTIDEYDALVFYDMWQEINKVEKKAYLKLLNEGKGMIFLHHSLVSYQHWPEFQHIIGGKYIELEYYNGATMKGSTYHEDITLDIKIVNKNHPVTHGLSDFSIFDEGYRDIEMSSSIDPLLSTSHPDCTPVVAWANEYKNSKIIYILLGHGQQAHENQDYRKLIRNAISWVSAKD
jgi:type 1 glutamine amidotransferase